MFVPESGVDFLFVVGCEEDVRNSDTKVFGISRVLVDSRPTFSGWGPAIFFRATASMITQKYGIE